MKCVQCSVVIVGYNHAAELSDCLDGLLAQSYSNYEVILVDNASQDDTSIIVQRYGDRVRYLRLPENGGFVAGNNAGAVLARGDVLVFLNPDAVPRPRWLETLVQPLFEDESIGLTTSKVLLADVPHLVNTCGNDLTWTGLTVCRGLRQPSERWQQAGAVIAVSGAACAIRRPLFEMLGGFDESFFLYYEDTDLSLRAGIAGYRIWYVADSIVSHRYAFRFSALKAYYQERNRWLALFKTLSVTTLMLLLPGLLLGEVIAWGYAALNGPAHLRAKLYGWIWIWRNRRLWWQKRGQAQALRRVSDEHLLVLFSSDLRFTGTIPDRAAGFMEAIMKPLLAGYGALCRRLTVHRRGRPERTAHID